MKSARTSARTAILSCALLLSFTPFAFAQPGNTQIANWKDNKKSALSLQFDDSVPTGINNVFPELQKRGLVGTFYINPGMHHYKQNAAKWEAELPRTPVVVLGNHTMAHDGLKDYASGDTDLKQVNAIILKAHPGKEPRLISFAKPGVGKDKWTITDEDFQKVLKANNLVPREEPGLAAAVFHLKTPEDFLNHMNSGIEKGQKRSFLFHGVGGDWLSVPTETLIALLDGIVAKKDQLWVTDHISLHKYETERKTAKVNVLESSDKKLKLELKSEADPQLYDGPLTLTTQVPANWKNAQVTQGASKTIVPVTNGQIQFDAVPGTETITLTPAA